MEKSLNQLYKESGTTLSYKEWRRREDDKMLSFGGTLPPPNLSDSPSFQRTKEELERKANVKDDINPNRTFGIPNSVLIIGIVVILGTIGYKVYTKMKQK
jgi:hypothetical protein